MANTVEDLETLLHRLDRRFERLDDGTILVRFGAHQPPVALLISDPVLVLQVEIGPAPKDEQVQARLFRKLLELNASDLVHAAYGLGDAGILLMASLEMANLDPNELEATLADFDLALAEQVSTLHDLNEGK